MCTWRAQNCKRLYEYVAFQRVAACLRHGACMLRHIAPSHAAQILVTASILLHGQHCACTAKEHSNLAIGMANYVKGKCVSWNNGVVWRWGPCCKYRKSRKTYSTEFSQVQCRNTALPLIQALASYMLAWSVCCIATAHHACMTKHRFNTEAHTFIVAAYIIVPAGSCLHRD